MPKYKLNINLNDADTYTVHVKSEFEAEFRRFSLKRSIETPSFKDFSDLVAKIHGLNDLEILICYVDPGDKDLLPINNDQNFERALRTAQPTLRIVVERKQDVLDYGISNRLHVNNKCHRISMPVDFRQISTLELDNLPITHRRVHLLKQCCKKPLGIYIRDGTAVLPGIFISRLEAGGLAESTGLLSANDEIIEVNGVEVAGKTLDQVSNMILANSAHLIITVKLANPPTNYRRDSLQRFNSYWPICARNNSYSNTYDLLEHEDQDEIVDLTGALKGDLAKTDSVTVETTDDEIDDMTVATTDDDDDEDTEIEEDRSCSRKVLFNI